MNVCVIFAVILTATHTGISTTNIIKMTVKPQIIKSILADREFRLGLCLALERSEDRVKKLARENKVNGTLTLGAALEYYKCNGFPFPTNRENTNNLQNA